MYIKKLAHSLIFHGYSSIFMIYIPFIYLKKFKKSFKNINYRKRWAERFAQTKLRLKDSIWIHSVSVGETLSAEPLVKKLIEDYPNERFVITTITPTGSDVVKRLYDKYPNVYHMYIPYDIHPFINSFFVKLNPKLFVIIETEIWPNILNKCFKENIPVIVTNARLSKRSIRNYKSIPFGKDFLFSKISQISTQTEKDAKRYCSLGVPKDNIAITGNLKYSMITPDSLDKNMQALKYSLKNRPVWIAGSTHDGEEEIILNTHKKILLEKPNCLLILVPRHKERFSKVEKLISKNLFTYQKRSLDKEKIDDNNQVYLGDTMGELLHLYHIADVTFVGGSLIENGGHNLLEPAALSKPIISGSSLFNFSQISKALLKNKALIRIKNKQDLAEEVLGLFNNEKKLAEMSKNAHDTFIAHSNVLEQQYNQITKFL